MKFVLNKAYGGFSLTASDITYLKDVGVIEPEAYDYWNIPRNNPMLIKGLESGAITGKEHSALDIVEIPDSASDYYIDEYDGWEHIIYVVDGKINFG